MARHAHTQTLQTHTQTHTQSQRAQQEAVAAKFWIDSYIRVDCLYLQVLLYCIRCASALHSRGRNTSDVLASSPKLFLPLTLLWLQSNQAEAHIIQSLRAQTFLLIYVSWCTRPSRSAQHSGSRIKSQNYPGLTGRGSERS